MGLLAPGDGPRWRRTFEQYRIRYPRTWLLPGRWRATSFCELLSSAEQQNRFTSPGGERKDGGLIYFARPFNVHKVGDDVLAIPSSVYEGRVFRVVFGGEVDTDHINQLRSTLGESVGRLEVYAGVSENEKFSLLTRSSLLLFPSYFEGFGYPPLEAALVGTPSVCYDLPVLRETLGTSGYFAPVGDISSFSHQARKALSSYTYGDGLRDRAEKIAGFDRISQKLSECMETWEPIPVEANHYTVLWGPWSANDIHHERSTDPKDDASVPPYGKASENTAGKVEVKIIIRTRGIAVSDTM